MLKIITSIVVVLCFNITFNYSSSADDLNMKIYCSKKRSGLSFPFTKTPVVFHNDNYEEAYILQDVEHLNSYQFYYKKLDKQLTNKEYLDAVITERIIGNKSKLLSKKIYFSGNKIISEYSYKYYMGKILKFSNVKAVISNGYYYSWAVQSYKDASRYDSDYIFKNYSNYVEDNGKYCP